MKIEIDLYQSKWQEPIEGGLFLSLNYEGRVELALPGDPHHRALYVEPKELLAAVQLLETLRQNGGR